MPFGRRKGCHLRVIGEGLGWANVRVCARLPAGSHILYHLARLDRRTLERLIEEKVIRPGLKEREAKAIGRSISSRNLQDAIDSGRSPGAAASAGRVFCRQFGRLERGRHGPGRSTTDPNHWTDWRAETRFLQARQPLNRSTKQLMKTSLVSPLGLFPLCARRQVSRPLPGSDGKAGNVAAMPANIQSRREDNCHSGCDPLRRHESADEEVQIAKDAKSLMIDLAIIVAVLAMSAFVAKLHFSHL